MQNMTQCLLILYNVILIHDVIQYQSIKSILLCHTVSKDINLHHIKACDIESQTNYNLIKVLHYIKSIPSKWDLQISYTTISYTSLTYYRQINYDFDMFLYLNDLCNPFERVGQFVSIDSICLLLKSLKFGLLLILTMLHCA